MASRTRYLLKTFVPAITAFCSRFFTALAIKACSFLASVMFSGQDAIKEFGANDFFATLAFDLFFTALS